MDPCLHLRPHKALRLCLALRLLQYLDRGLVAVDQLRVQQVIAQQVDDRLHSLADAHDTGGQRVAQMSPPKRRSSAAVRYSGMPNWYLPVMTHAWACSVSSPRGMMRAGVGATFKL